MSDWNILHCFADEGVESEALSAYGTVYRVGWDIRDTNDSIPIQADAENLPFKDGVTFDLGLFHPPCLAYSNFKYLNEAKYDTTYDYPELIPVAREIAEKYCENYIIENLPSAPLNDPVVLNGRMFGLPLHYERAFETNYHVEQFPRYQKLVSHEKFDEANEKGGWHGSYHLWKSAKGYSNDYDVESFKRAAVPRPYIDYLVRGLL